MFDLPNLEDTFALVGNSPFEGLEVCLLALGDDNIILHKRSCNIGNIPAVAPGVQAVSTSPHILNSEATLLVGINSVIVILTLVSRAEGGVTVSEEYGSSGGWSPVTENQLSGH